MRQVVPRVIPGRRSEAEAERGASRGALSCAPQHEGPLMLRSARGSRPGLILRSERSERLEGRGRAPHHEGARLEAWIPGSRPSAFGHPSRLLPTWALTVLISGKPEISGFAPE